MYTHLLNSNFTSITVLRIVQRKIGKTLIIEKDPIDMLSNFHLILMFSQQTIRNLTT